MNRRSKEVILLLNYNYKDSERITDTVHIKEVSGDKKVCELNNPHGEYFIIENQLVDG